MVAVERRNDKTVQVVHVVPQQSSVALHEGVCGPPDAPRGPEWAPGTPVLLLPPGYQILDPENAPALMSELMLVRGCLEAFLMPFALIPESLSLMH